ncbi:hypothetical protein VC83_01360 [Pseudogymnoascus destructans]|uniref:High-affinity Zn(2+) transporter zrt1 n=2 Tax=Pseudogymnoascus destructans TaxID=655981 RepID=L8G5I8_PSED2|nr:uncharacterized protein VC83_01360 [Pseudogymnoascus destructans]ELR07226.1 hypothetical protein GMDG_02453 [Pseudogymnoascus destructans 20631-21]OAF62042.1 hypothetical protein VC83_01360 [Pseudogymnoascus destructans]
MLSKPLTIAAVVLQCLVLPAIAQVTLTGCHLHGDVEYCFLPNGEETKVGRPTSSLVTASPTASPTAPSSVAAATTAAAQTTAITGCHSHGTMRFCIKGNGEEVQVMATQTGDAPLPTAYNGCHYHGVEMFCIAPDGTEVEVAAAEAAGEHPEESGASGENCHFHAGVEHCVGGSGVATCERKDRDYNINLRIGLIFPMLFASALAVYAPLVMKKMLKLNVSGIVFTIIKQFGTGVIISTGFVHLLTHAELMFGNECLGELKYEATTTAIAMAGAFIAFLIEYLGHRLASWRRRTITSQALASSTHKGEAASAQGGEAGKNHPSHGDSDSPGLAALSHHHTESYSSVNPNDTMTVLVLEAGIIFHSILLGITLIVAGDSVFVTLYVVIIFHQMFEGLALGARIAAIDDHSPSDGENSVPAWRKAKNWAMPLTFAVITPIGMAIGIGVLNTFNGNNPSTIIALGTLDALSAGVLIWVGLVSLWAHDWLFGDLKDAPLVRTVVAGVSFVGGSVLMGVLGKWA